LLRELRFLLFLRSSSHRNDAPTLIDIWSTQRNFRRWRTGYRNAGTLSATKNSIYSWQAVLRSHRGI